MVLKRIFKCFELTSGLKINLAKSMLIDVGCNIIETKVPGI